MCWLFPTIQLPLREPHVVVCRVCPGSPHHAATDAPDENLSYHDSNKAQEAAVKTDQRGELIIPDKPELIIPEKASPLPLPSPQQSQPSAPGDKPCLATIEGMRQLEHSQRSQSQKSASAQSPSRHTAGQPQPAVDPKVNAQLAMLDNQLRNILKTAREESANSSSASDRPKPKEGSTPEGVGPLIAGDSNLAGGSAGPDGEVAEGEEGVGMTNGMDAQLNGVMDVEEPEKEVCYEKDRECKPIRIGEEESPGQVADMPKISLPGLASLQQAEGEAEEPVEEEQPVLDEDGEPLPPLASGIHARPMNGSVAFAGFEERSMTNALQTSVYMDEIATRAAPYTLASQFNVSLGSSDEDSDHEESNHWEVVPRAAAILGSRALLSPNREKRHSFHGVSLVIQEDRPSPKDSPGGSDPGRPSDLGGAVPAQPLCNMADVVTPQGEEADVEDSNGDTEKCDEPGSLPRRGADWLAAQGLPSPTPLHQDLPLHQALHRHTDPRRAQAARSQRHGNKVTKPDSPGSSLVVQSRSLDSIGDKSDSHKTKLQGILKRADSEHSALGSDKSKHGDSERSKSRSSPTDSHAVRSRSGSKVRLQSNTNEDRRACWVEPGHLGERGAADGASPRGTVVEDSQAAGSGLAGTSAAWTQDVVAQKLEQVAQSLSHATGPGSHLPPAVRHALRLDLNLEREASHPSSSDSAKPDENPSAASGRDSARDSSEQDAPSLQTGTLHQAPVPVEATAGTALPDDQASPDSGRLPRPPANPAPHKSLVASAAR